MDENLINDIMVYFAKDKQDYNMVELAVRRAIRSFAKKRNYPSSYTEKKKEADMEECQDCIFDLAIYFLIKQGAEFQSSHSENSVNRTWDSESDIFVDHGVFPFVNALK